MKKIILQILGVLILIPALAMATMRFENRNADGPSILFPGGEMTSGQLHTGPEPDWSFTDDIETVDLQLNNPMASRLIYVLESENRLFIISGYMTTMLGRLWKEWAFRVEEGSPLVVARMNGTRYERELVRVDDPVIIEGVAQKLATKYMGGASPETVAEIGTSVADGDTWIFEMKPRSEQR